MTEREEKLNFMATYLEDKEYDNPWKVVAVLDLYKAYFDEDTPEEEIQNILEKSQLMSGMMEKLLLRKKMVPKRHIEYIMTMILMICSMTLDKTT